MPEVATLTTDKIKNRQRMYSYTVRVDNCFFF